MSYRERGYCCDDLKTGHLKNCSVKRKKCHLKYDIFSCKRYLCFISMPDSLQWCTSVLILLLSQASKIGRNICIKNCIMWNKKGGGEGHGARFAPKVAFFSGIASWFPSVLIAFLTVLVEK